MNQRVRIEFKALELHPKEVALILALRKVDHGDVNIVMRDGRPQMIKQMLILNNLDNISNKA